MVGINKHKESAWVVFFLFPACAGLLLFTLIPILSSFVLTLFQWDLIGAPEFVLFENFQRLMGDDKFWKAVPRGGLSAFQGPGRARSDGVGGKPALACAISSPTDIANY